MKGLIGKKIGMTQVYDETGVLIPVTVVSAGPCKVVGVKTKERDGYAAVQVGFGDKKKNNVTKLKRPGSPDGILPVSVSSVWMKAKAMKLVQI